MALHEFIKQSPVYAEDFDQDAYRAYGEKLMRCPKETLVARVLASENYAATLIAVSRGKQPPRLDADVKAVQWIMELYKSWATRDGGTLHE